MYRFCFKGSIFFANQIQAEKKNRSSLLAHFLQVAQNWSPTIFPSFYLPLCLSSPDWRSKEWENEEAKENERRTTVRMNIDGSRVAWANPRASFRLVYRLALFLTRKIYICRHGRPLFPSIELIVRETIVIKRHVNEPHWAALRLACAQNPRARFTEDRRFITLTCNRSRKNGRTRTYTRECTAAATACEWPVRVR